MDLSANRSSFSVFLRYCADHCLCSVLAQCVSLFVSQFVSLFDFLLSTQSSCMFSQMPKRKSSTRLDLSLIDKVAKLDAYHALPLHIKNSQRDSAEALGTSRTTLRRMLDKENDIRESALNNANAKRQRNGKDEDIETALYDWWKFSVAKNIPLSGKLMCEKANLLAEKAGHNDFKATEGWFSHWKARKGIAFVKLVGEAAEADISAAEKFIDEELPERCLFEGC